MSRSGSAAGRPWRGGATPSPGDLLPLGGATAVLLVVDPSLGPYLAAVWLLVALAGAVRVASVVLTVRLLARGAKAAQPSVPRARVDDPR